MSADGGPHYFVLPRAGRPPSGGDRYNEGLLAALRPLTRTVRIEPPALEDAALARIDGVVWLDSLLLSLAPTLRARLPRATPLYLIAHALPSQLAAAGDAALAATARDEPALLAALQGALAPSATMAASLRARALGLPTWVIEPAVQRAPRAEAVHAGPLAALVIAHLVPNKGVLPLLRALRARGDELPPMRVRCVGRTDADPAYARACADELRACTALAARVTLVGPLPYEGVLAELARAEVLVSASRSESFGMAIADARASGVPVLARRGGHVDTLVEASSGGTVVDDDDALAILLIALARDPCERARRTALAEARPLPGRGWDAVARALLALPLQGRSAQANERPNDQHKISVPSPASKVARGPSTSSASVSAESDAAKA